MSDRTLSTQELGTAFLLLARARNELVARFRGSSMEPTVPDGAELLLRHRQQPAPGDIVAFVSAGRVVVHRVEAISTRHGSLLTRGDALWLPDPPLRDPQAVVGVVTGIRRGNAFAAPRPAPDSALRGAVLLLFRAAHHASPRATVLALEALRLPSRAARVALGLLQRLARRR